ncbi:uncharacterized protein LOC144820078 [Lissotriton helveticus]
METSVPAVKEVMSHLFQIQQRAEDNLRVAKEKYKKYADRKRLYSVGATHVKEMSFDRDVLPAFVDGLHSLMSVADTLLASTDLQQGIQNVRQLLEASERSLSKAEESSLEQVKALSATMEERLDNINRLNDDQKAQQAKEQSLKGLLSGLQGQEAIATQQLQAAKDAVKNADVALERTMQAWQSAENQKKAGMGLVFIPIVGTIAGSVMIAKANEAIGRALNEAEEIKRMKNINKADVDQYESQLRSDKSAIRSIEKKIVANADLIQLLQRDLNSEKALYQNLNKFLIPLRKCTSFLSTLAGKTSAASISVEFNGLLGVLDEIVVTLRPLVESSKEYSLLITAKLPTIIHKLTEANSRLKKAAAR